MKTPDSHFYITPLTAGTLVLSEEESAHAIRVCRAREGDVLELCDGEGHFADGTVITADSRQCAVRVDSVQNASSPRPGLSLGLACLKDEANEEVAFHVAQMNVGAITLLRTERSQEPKDSNLSRVVRRCELKSLVSLKQSKKPWLTRIGGPVTLEDFLKDYHGDLVLCDIGGSDSAPETAGNVTILVGPEGGFSDREVELIKNFKGGQVHLLKLGNTRLRARTAAVVAIGKMI